MDIDRYRGLILARGKLFRLERPVQEDIRFKKGYVVFHGYQITRATLLQWLGEMH